MAPKIDRKNLQNRKIRVGSPLKMEADVKGEPEPTITWTFQSTTLKSEGRLTIENKEYHTSFVLEKTTRADTGILATVVRWNHFYYTKVNEQALDPSGVEWLPLPSRALPPGSDPARHLIANPET